jgi:hypothetical protein
MLRPRHLFLALSLLGVSSGCGGAERPAESAAGNASADGPAGDDAEGSGETSGATQAGDGENGESESTEPQRPSCDDGTCTPCGSSLCPSGWYCDESAKGGPACGWLPECAKKPSCACVKRAFSGCSCEEQGGGVHLSCG